MEDEIDGVKIQRLPTYGSPYSIKTRKQGRRGSIDGILTAEQNALGQDCYKPRFKKRRKKQPWK